MINYQLLFDAECERFCALRNEIKKQDTEIERLKDELKKRVSTRYSEIQDEAYTEAMMEIEKKDAEIARLKGVIIDAGEVISHGNQVSLEKDAEIERLKDQLKLWYEGAIDPLKEIARLRALITELADALEIYANFSQAKLIQRAREATE
jgi:hypothetical protein